MAIYGNQFPLTPKCPMIKYMAMDQYLYIPFLGEHPFTSYFDVHQGDRVLTHPHIDQHLPLQRIFPIHAITWLPWSVAAVPGYGKMSRPYFSSGEGIRVRDLND